MQLGDLLNAQVKMRHGALSHIITARILDSHPSGDQLKNLIDNPELLDKLSAHIAKEVLPGPGTGAADNAGANDVALPKLPKSNSWSDLLLYERDGVVFF